MKSAADQSGGVAVRSIAAKYEGKGIALAGSETPSKGGEKRSFAWKGNGKS